MSKSAKKSVTPTRRSCLDIFREKVEDFKFKPVHRCWLPNYSSVAFWFLFYFDDLFVCIFLLGYITKRSSFKKMLRYSRNTLISLRNGWKSWRMTLTPIQASLHPPLSSQTWNELKSLNLLSSRRGQRGRNHLRCLSRQPFSDRLGNQQCNSTANSLNSSNHS